MLRANALPRVGSPFYESRCGGCVTKFGADNEGSKPESAEDITAVGTALLQLRPRQYLTGMLPGRNRQQVE